MGNSDSPESVLLDSQQVRDFIQDRCNSLHMDINHLSKHVTGSFKELRLWMDYQPNKVTQNDIYMALHLLGVDVSVTLVVTPVASLNNDTLDAIEQIKSAYVKDKNES